MPDTTTHNLIDLALFDGVKDNQPKQKSLPWAKLVRNLTVHVEREEKDGPLFSPTLYRRRATRKLENVQTISLLVMDFDAGVPLETFTALWEPYEYVAYSTFSHTEEKPKFRAAFPLAAPVPADQWPRIYRNLVAVLGLGHTDPACKDASRIYYLPSCAPGAPRFAHHHIGAWLDPHAFSDVEPLPQEPEPERPGRPSTPATYTNGRVDATELLNRALDRCSNEGRNNAGLWLACQLRDNRYDRDEAETVLRDYTDRVPDTGTPYTIDEALHSLDQAYNSPARTPWEQPRPFSLGGAAQPEAEDLSYALEAAKAAIAAVKEDPGAIFTPEALRAFGTLRRWDPVNWARLSVDLKKAQADLRELRQQLERQEKREEQETGPKPRRAGEMLDECPNPQLIIPHPYILQANATGRIVETDHGTTIQEITFAPILITGRARDTWTGQESLLLAWKYGREGWQSRIVDRQSAMVGRKLAELSAYGFPYHEEYSKALTSYLARLEAANRYTLPCARVTSHLGWQGSPEDAPFLCGGALILPDGEIDTAAQLDAERPDTWRSDRVMLHGLGEGEAQIVQSLTPAGTWEGWLEAVQLLIQHHRAATTFYAAFCPPLLEIFKVPNFIVDLGGATTTGKTTSIRLAASIWYNPDDRTPTSGIYSWDVTRVFVERLVHTLSGLPLILDDTKRIKNERLAAEIIYLATNGRGRGRGAIQGVAHTTAGRTVLFSTGEQPVTSFTQDGGTRTRTLSIRGLPLGAQSPEAGALAKLVNRRICEHYGHAGPRFVQWVMTQKAEWDEWRRQYETWVEYYSSQPPTPEAGRLAQYAALVTIAGKLAHAALNLPWEYTNPMLQIWRELADAGADAAGELRALETVLAWAYSHERSFYGRTKQDLFGREEGGPNEISGRWDHGDDWEFLAFFRTVLDRILSDHGFQPEAILTGWREKGWLDCAEGGFTKRTRCGGGNAPHMVKIKRTAIEAVEGERGSRNAA